jgi:hypothetical protein
MVLGLAGYFFVWTGWVDRPSTGLETAFTVANLAALVGLVAVTLRFTQSTREIGDAGRAQAEATLEQAELTRQLAEEAETARQDRLRPLMVLHHKQIAVRADREPVRKDEYDTHPVEFLGGTAPNKRIDNIGNGPAVNGRLHQVKLIGKKLPLQAHVGLGGEVKSASVGLDSLETSSSRTKIGFSLPIGGREDYYLRPKSRDVFGRHFCARYHLVPVHANDEVALKEKGDPRVIRPRRGPF